MEAQEILRYAAHAAYFYVGLFLVLGTLGLPFPEEIILLLAGYLAGTGVVHIWIMLPYTMAILVVADNGMYYTSRKFGRGFVKKWGRYVFISKRRLKKFEGYFEKRGNKAVFFSRLLIGFRSSGIIMAGISKMPWREFLLWDTLSIALYLPIVLGIGYLFHYNLNYFLQKFALVKHIIFGLVIAIIFSFLIKKLVSDNEDSEDEDSGSESKDKDES